MSTWVLDLRIICRQSRWNSGNKDGLWVRDIEPDPAWYHPCWILDIHRLSSEGERSLYNSAWRVKRTVLWIKIPLHAVSTAASSNDHHHCDERMRRKCCYRIQMACLVNTPQSLKPSRGREASRRHCSFLKSIGLRLRSSAPNLQLSSVLLLNKHPSSSTVSFLFSLIV